jgi:hypothetical protein
MNEWNTNASALLPGARSGPVGTPSGITDVSSEKSEMNRAGNSAGDMPALGANWSPSPKEMKWSRQAISFPAASTPPFR